jgi:hypothetical protein
MQIRVSVVAPPAVAELVVPRAGGPGLRFVFSENIVLEQYDGAAQNNQLAGSHSGFVTTLRIATANDGLYPQGSHLFQFESLYRFNAVPGTPLQKGQVIAQGVIHGNFDSSGFFTPSDPHIKLAIIGGTDAYATARGQVTERDPAIANKLLDIQL